MVERVVVGGEGWSSSSVTAGEGVLVAQGGSSWVLEHHQSTWNMRKGSGEAMRGGGGGSTASRRRWCSGGLGRGTGEWVRGMERGGPPGTGPHERREIGALPRAVHGGDDVAAGGALGGAWQSRGGHSERGRGRWGAQARRVGASASRRWPGRRP